MVKGAVVLALMTWIHGQTGLPIPPNPPEIELKTEAEMRDVLRVEVSRNLKEIWGLTFNVEGHPMWMSNALDYDNPIQASWLLHELVHDMQNSAKIGYPCFSAKEAVAYKAQDAWLRQHGSSLEKVAGWKPSQIDDMAQCRR
jgi:hypothetical protein